MAAHPPPADNDLAYRALFDAHPHPMWVRDLETAGILTVNEAALAQYGYSRQEFLALAVDAPAEAETAGARHHRRRDGSIFPVEVTTQALDFQGRRGRLVIARPTGESPEAAAALRASEAKLRAIFETGPECVKLVSLDGRLLEMNPAGLRMIEATDNPRVFGAMVELLVHPEDRAIYRRLHEDAAAGIPGQGQFRVTGLRGTQLWLETHSVPMRPTGGAVESILSVTRDITPRRLAEEALAAARRQADLILASIADGVHVLDADGAIQLHNPAAHAMLGWSDDEVLGRRSHGLVHHHRSDGSAYPLDQCPVFQTLQDGITRRVENEFFFRKDGTAFPVEYVAAPLRDDQDRICGAVLSFRDVSERRRADRVQSSKTAILEMIAAGASMPAVLEAIALAIEELCPGAIASILLLDPDGVHMRHGAAPNLPDAYVRAVDGLPIGPSVGSCGTAMHLGQPVITPDLAASPLWRDYLPLALAHGLRSCWSLPVHSPAGTVAASFALYHREVRSPRDDELALMAPFANLVSIAVEHIRTVESLRESEERFRQLAENIGEVFWMSDPGTGQVLYVSPAYETIWGRPRETLVGQAGRWMDAIHEADRDDVLAAMALHATGRYTAEYRIVRPDGSVRWIHDRGFPVRDADGRIYRIVGTARDITDRRQAEDALDERIKELRCLYRVLELTSDQTRPTEEICRDIAHTLPDSMLHAHMAVARVSCDGVEHFRDGWRTPAELLRVPIISGAAEVGFVEVGYPDPLPPSADGTGPFMAEERALVEAVAAHIGRMLDSRRLAGRLMQSERLSAVGELTGGIAHDFNNLLTVILGNAELLVDELADRPKLAQMAEITRTAAERGADLTYRLLAFARRQALAPTPTQVDRLMSGMRDLLQRTLGEQVEMQVVHAADLWPAAVDPSQLENAVLNLCINARDAMPDGGRLTIELANTRLGRTDADWNEDGMPGDFVLVAVSDTGVGMSAQVLARAFEPFYTTKEIGRGSGLGLSMVYGFVKQSRGHVKIQSEPGHGTVVKLYLPRASTGAGAEAAPDLAPDLPRGRERILLVEDDDLVRDHATAQLRGLGYTVTAVRAGQAALEILRSDQPFDLLFTDVVMPGGLNGRQLADHALRLRPDLPILFTSGYTDDAIVHHGRLDPGVHLLNKPYRRAQLAEKVRLVLDQPRPR